MFIVETRGRTLEETAALFDGADKPDRLAPLSGETAVIALRHLSTSSDELDDDDFFYPDKVRELESYEPRRPQIVLERERVGHTKGKAMMLSFDRRI